MKLLFDENLSHKLVQLLADLFPTQQVVYPRWYVRAADADRCTACIENNESP